MTDYLPGFYTRGLDRRIAGSVSEAVELVYDGFTYVGPAPVEVPVPTSRDVELVKANIETPGTPLRQAVKEAGQEGLSATYALKGEAGGGGADTSFAYNLMHKLTHDTGNAVLAVSGDSVSIDSDGWVRRLTNKLAAEFPKFTVVYKAKTNGANTYAANVTVQTGAGGNGNTLTVYNWSQSGATVGIGLDAAAFPIAYPAEPDLFLIATGHNDWAVPRDELARYIRNGVRRLASAYSHAPVAVVTMNPKNPAETHYLHKFRTEQAKIGVAGALGLGVLDLETAWLDRAQGYATLMADDVHPNADGSELLASTAFAAFGSAVAGSTGWPRRVREDMLVPLLGGVAAAGTPAPVMQGGYSQTMAVRFAHNSDDDWVCPPIQVPEWWNSFSVELVWSSQGNTGAGEAFHLVLNCSCLSAGNNATNELVVDATVPASSVPQGQVQVSVIKGDSPPHVPAPFARTNGAGTPFAPWQFRVKRPALTSAADTLADGYGDVLIYALRLIRVS